MVYKGKDKKEKAKENKLTTDKLPVHLNHSFSSEKKLYVYVVKKDLIFLLPHSFDSLYSLSFTFCSKTWDA